MLTVERSFMTRELHMHGVPISEIARLTAHGRKLNPYVPYLELRTDPALLNCSKLSPETTAQPHA